MNTAPVANIGGAGRAAAPLGLLKDRVAIVTGGAQGLGQALSMRMAREGARVVVADINLAQAAETARGIMAVCPRDVIPLSVDVTDEAQVRKMVDHCMQRFGRLDVAIANAGILTAGEVTAFDAERWMKIIQVNLFGYFLVIKHAAAAMKQQQFGRIIQINSKSGLVGSKNNSPYAASKFGGIGLTQSAALELAPFGITVNSICPGNLLDSPLWTDPERGLFVQYLRAGKVPGATTVDDVRAHYMRQVPMGRGCEYDDICSLAVFLASDQSSYMTGLAVPVTGGQVM